MMVPESREDRVNFSSGISVGSTVGISETLLFCIRMNCLRSLTFVHSCVQIFACMCEDEG